MPTLNQLVSNPSSPSRSRISTILNGKPQRKAVCVKVYTTSPRKPNSAVRKVAKVQFEGMSSSAMVAMPGFGHTLSEHSVVLISGGSVPDLPGVRYRMVSGKYDFVMAENLTSVSSSSKFGVSKKSASF